jgi:hypothetical protein
MMEANALRVGFSAVVVLATLLGARRAMAAESPLERGASPPQLRVVRPEPDLAAMRQDRRNPVVDRNTGLFTDWYLRLRLEEEISRAARFGQRFAVVTIASAEGVGRDVTAQLARALRHVDYAADLGPAIAVVLPNTDADGAEIWRDRLDLPATCQTRIGIYPRDGKTVSTLLGEDQWAWPARDFGVEAS